MIDTITVRTLTIGVLPLALPGAGVLLRYTGAHRMTIVCTLVAPPAMLRPDRLPPAKRISASRSNG